MGKSHDICKRLGWANIGIIGAALCFLLLLQILPRGQVLSEAQTQGWLTTGDPVISHKEIDATYQPPYSAGYNTDCDTRDFNVVTREARSSWPEIRHTSSCAIMTTRGMTDGVYLQAGDIAGKFVGMSGRVQPIPNSMTLMGFKTLSNGIALRVEFYDAIMPTENQQTGEISYALTGYQVLKSSQGNEVIIRPQSYAFSRNGTWMVAEANGIGFVRINTETREILPFAPPVSPNTSSGPNKYIAVSEDGRYAALSLEGGRFKIYDISNCQAVTQYPLVSSPCGEKDIEPFVRMTFSGYVGSYYLRFATSNLLTFVAYSRDEGNALHKFRVRLAPSGHVIEDINYLALGDSFSSGEGAENYALGTDTPENKCHLSINSYPFLAASLLDVDTFRSVACSAAKTSDYEKDIQADQPLGETQLGDWLPGLRPQKMYLAMASPNVVTISMIGNDIGFSDKLTKCIVGTDSCFHFREDRQGVAAEIASKFDTLVDMYASIKESANNENLKVYVLGYPQLFSTQTTCAANVRLDLEERVFSRGLVVYLNAVIRAATQKAGVQYIDVEDAFSGKQLCDSGEKAVNGLTAGNDVARIIGNESFHPNKLGHKLLADSLAQQSVGFTSSMPVQDTSIMPPSEGTDAYEDLLGNAPWGSTFKRWKHTSLEGVDFLVHAKKTVLKPVGLLMPNSEAEVTIHSEPVFVGTLHSNAQGVVSGEITVPNTVSPGFHTIHITGKDLANRDTTLYKVVYIAAQLDDYDGDGVLNVDEKCLAVDPVNEDIDQDGVDDACDGQITDRPIDTMPPVVIGTAERRPDYGTWYTSDVAINWHATDPDPSSGWPTQPDSTMATQEGVNLYESGSSCDTAQNCAAGSLEIALDKTAPVIESLEWKDASSQETITVKLDANDTVSGIRHAEYFVGGRDPGIGNAIPITTEGNNGIITVVIGLDPGVHRLTFRVQDAAGHWSGPASKEAIVLNDQQIYVHGAGLLLPVYDSAGLFNLDVNMNHSHRSNAKFEYTQRSNVVCFVLFPKSKCRNIKLTMTELEWAIAELDDPKTAIVQGCGNFFDGYNWLPVCFRLQFSDTGNASGEQFSLLIYELAGQPFVNEPIFEAHHIKILGSIHIKSQNEYKRGKIKW